MSYPEIHPAHLIRLTSDLPFWLLRNGLLNSYPLLQEDVTCDVAVVGAGVTGAILAERLSREGLDTVVLDRRDVGTGSTSASTALLQYEIDVSLVNMERLIGQEAAERAYRLSHSSIDRLESLVKSLGVDVGFQRKTSIHLAYNRRAALALAQEARARSRLGLDVEYHSHQAVANRFGLRGTAALSTRQAAACDPYRLTHALLMQAQKQGARVFDRTSISSSSYAGEHTTLTTDRGHSVTARHVVYAAGFEGTRLLRERVVDLDNTYALVSEPLATFAPWHQDWMLWEAKQPYLYLRATQDGRLLVGGEDDAYHSPARRDRSIGRKAQLIERKVRLLLPDLKWDPAYQWAGTFGKTRDGLAYIGPSAEHPGAWFALCFGGNGMTFSALAADIILEFVQTGSAANADLFRFGR